MIRTIAFTLAVFLAAALPAAASTISFSQTDFGDFVSNDIAITTTGTWSQMQLITHGLADGDVYQHNFGGEAPPNPALVASFADLAFDTFLANGTLVDAPATNGILAIGGAVNLGGSAGKQFGTHNLNVTWGPALGQNPTDIVNWLAARITLADTANGTFKLLSSDTSDGKGMQIIDNGLIVNGAMMVPEPSTFLMLAVGSLGLLLLRRK